VETGGEPAGTPHDRVGRKSHRMQPVVLTAIDRSVPTTDDDELTASLAVRGAERFANLLARLGE